VRANRASAAAILVAENANMLPGQAGFGQVSPFDFVVAFNPQVGDETALMCGLYLAKVAAISTIAGDSESRSISLPQVARSH